MTQHANAPTAQDGQGAQQPTSTVEYSLTEKERRAEAERFLSLLDRDAQSFCFQTFDDLKDRKDPSLARTLHGSLTALWPKLEAFNRQGAGVFVTVNAVRPSAPRNADNVIEVRAAFADFDPPETAPAPDRYPIPPGWQVETSPGKRHVYWPVEGLALSHFRKLQERIIHALGSDPQPKDLPRVMRLPGFHHMKDPDRPYLVRLVDVAEVEPYTVETLARAFPQIQKPAPAGTTTATGAEGFFGAVNAQALARLEAWFVELFPSARPYHDGFRVSSRDLGRDLEEDLSAIPQGIRDFGEETGKTPIDLVMQWGSARDAKGAAFWLCERLNVDPAALGWTEPSTIDASVMFADLIGAEPANDDADEADDDWDPVCPPPQATEGMFHGLVGEIALTGARNSEASPVAIAAAALSWFSVNVGRDLGFHVGDTLHPLALFMLHVGRTSVARKGDALGLVKRIDAQVRRNSEGLLDLLGSGGEQDEPSEWCDPPHLVARQHAGGLSSLEGLAALVADPVYNRKGEPTQPGFQDKRLWVQEPEFGNVFAQSKRDGNTLSMALRVAWDGGDIKPATRKAETNATSPHISVLGAITPFELRALLTTNDVANGLLNRFLLFFAERAKLIPWPVPTPEAEINRLAEHAQSVLLFARGQYPERLYSRTIQFSPAARDLYSAHYPVLSRPGSDLVGAALARRPAITLRLAALFAVLDERLEVGEEHLRAALAWSDFHEASARYVLAGAVRAGKSVQRDRLTDRALKILERVEGDGWIRRSKLTQAFSKAKGADAAVLDTILATLLGDGRIEQREESKGGAVAGSVKLYRLLDRG